MSDTPYFGIVNEVETSIALGDSGSGAGNVRSRFVEVVAVSGVVGNYEIVTHWNGDEKLLSSFAAYGHNVSGAKGQIPTYKLQLYDDEDPDVGNLIVEVIGQPLSVGYEIVSGFGIADMPEQDLYTFTQQVGDRLVPRLYAAKSIRWTFSVNSGAYVWEIGYLWAGVSIALSKAAVMGAVDSPSATAKSRETRTKGAGIVRQDDRNIGQSMLEFPVLGTVDQVTLIDLFQQVGFDTPFFLHRFPQASVQRDRRSEGGVVRFVGRDMRITRRGFDRVNGDDIYSLEPIQLTVWR